MTRRGQLERSGLLVCPLFWGRDIFTFNVHGHQRWRFDYFFVSTSHFYVRSQLLLPANKSYPVDRSMPTYIQKVQTQNDRDGSLLMRLVWVQSVVGRCIMYYNESSYGSGA